MLFNWKKSSKQTFQYTGEMCYLKGKWNYLYPSMLDKIQDGIAPIYVYVCSDLNNKLLRSQCIGNGDERNNDEDYVDGLKKKLKDIS